MQINADFLLQKFSTFLYESKLNDQMHAIRWSKFGYSAAMKRRLGMAAAAIMQIPYGCLIFQMSDFRFSIGNQSVVATKLSDINLKSKWVYFDHVGSKSASDFRGKFSIPVSIALYDVRTTQPKSAGYRFKIELQDLVIFARLIEKLRPEVSMAIRRAYFDKDANPRCAMALTVSKIGAQKKIKNKQEVNIIKSMAKPLVGYKTPNSKFSFRPYQLVGVSFWRATNGRAMIGDQMGIGKTVQAIGCMKLAMDEKTIAHPLPALIVCPASVVSQWVETINEWIPTIKVQVMIGSRNREKLSFGKNTALITTYETMRRNEKFLLGRGFKMIVFDESHMLKNAGSGRSRSGTQLGTRTPFVLMLTGTPMENGIKDLWAQFHILDPNRFPNPQIFLEKLESYKMSGPKSWSAYCPMETSVTGKTSGIFERYHITMSYSDGSSRIIMKPSVDENSDMRRAFSCYMIRRLKSQVLDLPPKTRQVIKIPLDAAGKKLYESYERDAAKKIKQIRINNYIKKIVSKTRQYISEGMSAKKSLAKAKQECQWLLEKSFNEGMDAMLAFTDLKRQMGMLKTPMVIQKLTDFIRGTGGKEPILVFAEQHRVIDQIADKMSRYRKPNGKYTVVRKYTGKVSKAEREKIKKDFMDGKIDILILNKAGNVGLNLYRASYVMFAERYWNPTDEEQAEDRAHRSGQKNPVTVYYITIPDTIEDKVLSNIDKKRQEIENTVGNQSYSTSVRQQKVQTQKMMQQLQKHFTAFIGKVRVPDKEIKQALQQEGIRV